jgi:hypothetical protein
MTRLLLLTLLACAADVGPVERRTEELRTWERLERQQVRIEALERSQVELAEHIKQASVLAALGGPKRRYTGGVGCDLSAYMDQSNGWKAQQALLRCGLCDPAPLPVPTLAVK